MASSGTDGDAVGGGWTCDRPDRETIGETGRAAVWGRPRRPWAVRADAWGRPLDPARARCAAAGSVDPMSRRAWGGHSGRIAPAQSKGSRDDRARSPEHPPLSSTAGSHARSTIDGLRPPSGGGTRRLRYFRLTATIPQRGSMPQRTTAEADSCEPLGLHHARPVDQTVIACASGVHRRWPAPRRLRAPSWVVPFVPTCRPPSCTRTRSATGRASSRPMARSSSGPASTPVARRRTSSSSTSPAATTRSGGVRSTGRSRRPTTIDCGRG